MNFCIFFIAPLSLCCVRSTFASRSESILGEKKSDPRHGSSDGAYSLVMLSDLATHQTRLLVNSVEGPSDSVHSLILLPNHELLLLPRPLRLRVLMLRHRGERVSSRAANYFQLLEIANESSRPASPASAGGTSSGSSAGPSAFRADNMAEGYFKAFFQEVCRLGMGANGSVYLCQVSLPRKLSE